ncbi:MAG: hypothetical protein ACJ8OJ_18015 [Povalibacter sp.]
MRPTHEFTLELTAQELLDPPDLNAMVRAPAGNVIQIAHTERVAPSAAAVGPTTDVEIELTAEEIDALLEGRF